MQKNDMFDLDIAREEADYIFSISEFYLDVDKYYDQLFRLNISKFNVIVNRYCDKVSKERAVKGLTPYSFYNETALKTYRDKFEEKCRKKYNADFPFYLDMLFDWIALKCENFQSMSAYLFSYTQASRDINAADINKQINDFGKRVQKTQKELEKNIKITEKKLSESEKQMTERNITILGIFAAIVLTFNSGLTFSSTVLQNLINSNIYRAIIITIILGLIIANVLLGLFYYLEHVIEKSTKEKRKIKSIIPMLLLNFILAILLALTVWGWSAEFVENRGSAIKNDEPQTTQSTTVPVVQEVIEDDVLEEATIYAEVTVISIERKEKTETTTDTEESTTVFIDVTP